MFVHILNKRTTNFNLDTIIAWAVNTFTEVKKVHSPTDAEMYKFSYDNSLSGICVFYFKEESDYHLFLLKFS